MNLTEYLFHRLRELGVGHTFGIPGDFVLPVYAVQQSLGFPTVVCCHEPGSGSRRTPTRGCEGLGVALVTYGPGALNTLNPVACAYAEQSPLLVVSGGPEMSFRRGDHEVHLHHVVKTYESQLQIYREVTVDAAILDDPATAPETIDRVLRNVVRRKRPGYLEIPRDRVYSRRSLRPRAPLDARARGRRAELAHADALDEAVSEIGAMLAAARRPTLYVGVGIAAPWPDRIRSFDWPSGCGCPWPPTSWARPRFPRATPSSPESTWARWVIRPCGACSMAPTACWASASCAPIWEPASGPSGSTPSADPDRPRRGACAIPPLRRSGDR